MRFSNAAFAVKPLSWQRPGGRKAAERAAIYASMGKVSEEQAPDLHDIHICEDGGIGIADFLGFKERKDDE